MVAAIRHASKAIYSVHEADFSMGCAVCLIASAHIIDPAITNKLAQSIETGQSAFTHSTKKAYKRLPDTNVIGNEGVSRTRFINTEP